MMVSAGVEEGGPLSWVQLSGFPSLVHGHTHKNSRAHKYTHTTAAINTREARKGGGTSVEGIDRRREGDVKGETWHTLSRQPHSSAFTFSLFLSFLFVYFLSSLSRFL